MRKRPLAEQGVTVTAQAGSWNNYRTEIDGNAPVTDRLRLRAVAAYQDRRFSVDGQKLAAPALYGIAEFDATPQTRLSLGASWEKNDYDGYYRDFLPRFTDGRGLGLPRSSRGLAPAWNRWNYKASNGFGSIEQQLGENWSLKLDVNRAELWLGNAQVGARGAVDPLTLRGPRYTTASSSDNSFRNDTLNAALTGKVALFGREHDIVVGGNRFKSEATLNQVVAAVPQPTGSIFGYDYGSVPFPVFPTRSSIDNLSLVEEAGLYGMGRLNLADRLKLVLGGKRGDYRTKAGNTQLGYTGENKEEGVFIPYGGLLYDFATNWTAYVSYSEAFEEQSTLFTTGGTPLPPLEGANYEVGIKGALYDERLNLALAVFRIDQTNRPQEDPNGPAICPGSPYDDVCYLADGKVRGQGFEAELSGEPAPGWQIVLGYTFTDTEYLRERNPDGTPSAVEGRDFSSITPRHLVKIWSNYQFTGDFSRLSLGGGVNFQSGIYLLDETYKIEQSAYGIVNARIGYKLGAGMDASLNVNNLLDKNYYQRIGDRTSGNRYGEPRSFMLTIRASF